MGVLIKNMTAASLPLDPNGLLYFNEPTGNPAPNDYGDKQVSAGTLRKFIAAIAGTWDMTGVAVDATADASTVQGGILATVSAASQTLTPTDPMVDISSGAGTYGTYAKSLAAINKTGTTSARIKVPAIDPAGGDTVEGIALFLTQHGTTLESNFLKINGSGIAAGDGSYVVMLQIAATGTNTYAAFLSYVENGTLHSTIGVAIAGIAVADEIYLSVDWATGDILVQRGADAAINVATIDFSSETAGLDVGAVVIGSAATPVFAAADVDFDLSDATGGNTPFQEVGDAALPAGADDGMRYKVTAAGTFNGANTLIGDIVEIYNGQTEIIIYRLGHSDSQIQALIDASIAGVSQYDALAKFLANPVIYGVSNDPSGIGGGDIAGTLFVGQGVLVGTVPAGDFAAFTTGNVAVWDGSAFSEFTPPLGFRCTQSSVIVAGADYYALQYVGSTDTGQFPELSVGSVYNTPYTDVNWRIVTAVDYPAAPILGLDNTAGDVNIYPGRASSRYVVVSLGGANNIVFPNGGGESEGTKGRILLRNPNAGTTHHCTIYYAGGGAVWNGFPAFDTNYHGVVFLDAFDNAVIEWEFDASGSAIFTLVGGPAAGRKLGTFAVADGGTATLDRPYSKVLIAPGADIAACTIALQWNPGRQDSGEHISIKFDHAVAAITWDASASGGDVTGMPAAAAAGDILNIYRDGTGWKVW